MRLPGNTRQGSDKLEDGLTFVRSPGSSSHCCLSESFGFRHRQRALAAFFVSPNARSYPFAVNCILAALSIPFSLSHRRAMKIPPACYDRYSSSSAGELVGQFLGSLCLQYVVMDRSHPALDAGPRESSISLREQQQEESSESSVDAAVEGYSPCSDALLSRESCSYFHSASDHLHDAHEALRKEALLPLPAIGSLSSCTKLSESEFGLAEVNPVTFEIVPPSTQHGQRADMVACFRLTREYQEPFRPSDDVDSASDGESSHSAVYLSDSHSGGPPSPTANSVALDRSFHPTEEAGCSRVKLMCSFGGRIVSRPVDGKFRYVGGETRILAVNRGIGYDEFMSKMALFYGAPLTLKYQLPDEDLDALVSISSDDDLQNMMEEYDKLESSGGVSRLRLFFFTSPVDHETPRPGLNNEMEDLCCRSEQRYVDALNRFQEKISDNGWEDDETGVRRANGPDFSGSRMVRNDSSTGLGCSVSPVKTFSKVPSAPSSPPLSPSVAIRHAHLKPVQMRDSSSQVSKEGLDSVPIQNVSGNSTCASRVDYQLRKPSQSPRRIQHDRVESWRTGEIGMRRVHSQTRLMRQTEQQMDCGTVAGPTGAQQLPEMLSPSPNEHQCLVYQQHKRIPQQQHQQGWQSPMEGNLGRGETVQRCPLDVHRQPREAVPIPHQATQVCVHQTAADYDVRAWDIDLKGVPSFLHGSAQPRQRNLLGLTAAPSYQIASAPSSPRITPDCKGRCNCVLQHSQVHRGINVCLNDKSFCRRSSHLGDLHNRKHGLPLHLGSQQPTRKHGFSDSLGLCDNESHSGERIMRLQYASHFVGPEAETGNARWHVNERHTALCNVAECRAKYRAPQYCDSPAFTEPFLPSRDQCELNKTRCLCSGCYDGRREPVVLPVYTGLQDKLGGWIAHQRGLELDDGPTCAPGTGQILLYKDGELRGEFEVKERPGGKGDLYSNHSQGDFKSRLDLATPIRGVPCHGNLPMHMLPTSGPLAPVGMQISEACTTAFHIDGKQPSKPVAVKPSAVVVSWSNPSVEPRVQSNTPPSFIGHSPRMSPEEDLIKIPLCEARSTTHQTSNSLLVRDGTSGLEKYSACKASFKEKHDQDQDGGATESTVRNDTGRLNAASGVTREAVTELLSVPSFTHDGLAYHCESVQTTPSNGLTHFSSHNVITMSSLAPLKAESAAGQQESLPAASTMIPFEWSRSTSQTFNQSPFSTTDSTGILEPNKTTDIDSCATLDEKVFMSSMSVTGLLADGMISSVLKSCSNGEHCDEDRLVVGLELVNKDLKGVKKDETEQDTETVIGGLLPIKEGEDHSLKCAEVVNEWLKVSSEKEQLPGMTPVLHNDRTKGTAYEEKDVAAGNDCFEGNVSALRHSAAEARVRGLQIINNADLEDLRELGSGTFGTVFHGKWRGSDVAIKRIKSSCFMGQPSEQERLISDFWKEAHTLSQLHHPNVVAFYGVVPDGPEGTLATVTEYMVNGSLKKVLRKKDRTIDRRKRLIIAMGAAFGMEYLHSKNIVHFDLKCDNLLVNMKDAQRPICKVGDFGLSKVKHQTMVSGGVRGTLPWMAPELLSSSSSMVTEKIDVFSFGIVMWELLTGEEPYANMHHGTIIGGIVKNTLRPSIPSWCEPGWRALMERCWSGEPADRPSFSEVSTELRALAASINVR